MERYYEDGLHYNGPPTPLPAGGGRDDPKYPGSAAGKDDPKFPSLAVPQEETNPKYYTNNQENYVENVHGGLQAGQQQQDGSEGKGTIMGLKGRTFWIVLAVVLVIVVAGAVGGGVGGALAGKSQTYVDLIHEQ